MDTLQALALGVIQGLTEFLPVSSDGHLAIAYRLFGKTPNLAFEVFLHLATLLAAVVYFRADIAALLRSLLPAGRGSAERRLAWLIVLTTVVSGVLALALKRAVEAANTSLPAIAAGFLTTAAVLLAAEVLARRASRREPADLGLLRTVAIAVSQALAALPGVSRSGTTIAAGMLSGLDRESAARFSFLVGIPIIAAANVFEAKDVVSGLSPMPSVAASALGFIAAGVAGYLAIAGLLAIVRRRPLYAFSGYTALVGVAVLLWSAVAR